jgi:hypothetical protein
VERERERRPLKRRRRRFGGTDADADADADAPTTTPRGRDAFSTRSVIPLFCSYNIDRGGQLLLLLLVYILPITNSLGPLGAPALDQLSTSGGETALTSLRPPRTRDMAAS